MQSDMLYRVECTSLSKAVSIKHVCRDNFFSWLFTGFSEAKLYLSSIIKLYLPSIILILQYRFAYFCYYYKIKLFKSSCTIGK